VEKQTEPKRSRSFRKLAYDSVYRPGIDLAVIIAATSSLVDLVSLFLPWLVGVNSEYTPGRGLTYSTAIRLTGFDVFQLPDYEYVIVVIVPVVLTCIFVYLSVHSEGIIPPRISYKTKSRIILFLAMLTSMAPAFVFFNTFSAGLYLTSPRPGVFVGRWELGAGATMPTYAGFGFLLALGLKVIKD
jgi:hypothetical protein